MAGFEVSTNGRFCLSTEARTKQDSDKRVLGFVHIRNRRWAGLSKNLRDTATAALLP